MERNNSIDELVIRRNKRLLNFFTRHGLDVRLVGDNQKPVVILNDNIVLSCYVKNYDLHFVKDPETQEIVKSFTLKEDSAISKLEVVEAIEMCSHQRAYRIKHKDSGLYLVGYNYFEDDSAGSGERYPVFGKHKVKVYFQKEYALSLIERFERDNYNLELV